MSQDTLTHTTSSRRPFKQISFKERQLIEFLYRKKTPVSQIAHELGFHRSSIYRELKRGHVIHLDSELRKFPTCSADRAQDASSLALSARGPDLKIASHHSLVRFLHSLICRFKMSPYAAILVAKRKHFDVPVSSRTLYNYIHRFNFPASPSDLIHGPRRPRRKSVPKRLSHTNLMGLSIDKRPAALNDRSEFGHHEMDTVVGPPGSKATLLVLTERRSRFEHIILMKDKSQKNVRMALNRLERHYGARFPLLFKSITCDNGSEFLDAAAICSSCRTKRPRTILFYAHPYCACERGSNENANRLIRRFLPKGTDFSSFSQRDMDCLAFWINGYPRKLHGGKTARQLARQFTFHSTPSPL